MTDWRTYQLEKRKALVLDVVDFAMQLPENNTYVIIAHNSLPGEHEDTMYCWCGPDIHVAGAALSELVQA